MINKIKNVIIAEEPLKKSQETKTFLMEEQEDLLLTEKTTQKDTNSVTLSSPVTDVMQSKVISSQNQKCSESEKLLGIKNIEDIKKEGVLLNTVYLADCLDAMRLMKDKSVDLILTDPPYGTTACSWDSIVPFDEMWGEILRVIKDNGAIIMTASQPFTSELIHSNIKHFRHSWIWDKGLSGNIFLAKTQPMKIHEDILVFGKETPMYFPLKVQGELRKMRNNGMNDSAFGSFKGFEGNETDERNPKTILYFPNSDRKNIQHPTEKPIELFKYLVMTYSQENDVILDPFAGSGTTGVACKQLGRNYILIEKEEKYVEICHRRLAQDLLF